MKHKICATKNYVNTKLIFDFMKQNNLSKKQFSERCGISVGCLNRFLSGQSILSSKLRKIILALGVKAKDLLGI